MSKCFLFLFCWSFDNFVFLFICWYLRCYTYVATFTATFAKLETELEAINHAVDVQQIRKFVGKKCFKFPIYDDIELPETFYEDRFKLGCRHKVIGEYIAASNDEQIQQIWNKYSESLQKQVNSLAECDSE